MIESKCRFVYTTYAVYPIDLTRALQVASTIFGRAGIGLKWEHGDPSSSESRESDFSSSIQGGDPPPLHSGPLVIRVVERSPASLPAGALGLSLPLARRGVDVTVFADRTLAAERGTQATHAEILGYAFAHEMGHILLRSGTHSSRGVMRTGWTAADWQRLVVTRLAFDSSECARMRAALASGPGSGDRGGRR